MQAMMAAFEKFAPRSRAQSSCSTAWEPGTWSPKCGWIPAAPPMLSKGKSVQRAILGGRYVPVRYEGELMGGRLTASASPATTAYNKKYISLWMDSWGTGFYLTEGTCDAGGKMCTETGLWDDYMTGKNDEGQKRVSPT